MNQNVHTLAQPGETTATTPSQLQRKHADLKADLLRSAHTDHYTRSEREGIRVVLTDLSRQYREMTGHDLG